MKQRREKKNKYIATMALGACFLSLTSCDMINEELPPCPEILTTVNFVYDYNMLREDLFDQHAGTAHLYVFDRDSVFLFDRTMSRVDMPGDKVDFSMTFDTLTLHKGKRYLMVAMAQGNHAGYEAAVEGTPGFEIPIEHQMIPGVSRISDYRIVLDRDSDSYADIGIVNYKDAYGNNQAMIDTLWSTKPGQIQTVDIPDITHYPFSTADLERLNLKKVNHPTIDGRETYAQEVIMPMMRITNAIKVNLIHESFDMNTDVNNYHILIDFPKGNGTIGFTGRTFPNRELFYQAIRKEMTEYREKPNNVPYEQGDSRADNDKKTYAVASTFGVSRLQNTDGSSLQVRNARDNSVMVQIDDFAEWLADYFDSQYSYSHQEFLDREYDFTVDIHLDDNGRNDWIQIGCSILGWGKRIHFYDL